MVSCKQVKGDINSGLPDFILETYGYAAMFITMVLENANVPIPSEIVLGFSGYLIAQGVFEMNMTMIVATAAGVVGSILSYWMGNMGAVRCLENMVAIFSSMNINLKWLRKCLINTAVVRCSLAVCCRGFVPLFLSRPVSPVIRWGVLSFGLYSAQFLGRFCSYGSA